MREITVKLFKFSELSEEAKSKAVQKLDTINVEHDWWQMTYEDAENIGLKIIGFDLDRNRHCKGEFIASAEQVAKNIISEHGESCETYKTAKVFLDLIRTTALEDGLDFEDDEQEFLEALLEDYSIILQKECEYLQSKEAIIETIAANDYEFTADGSIH